MFSHSCKLISFVFTASQKDMASAYSVESEHNHTASLSVLFNGFIMCQVSEGGVHASQWIYFWIFTQSYRTGQQGTGAVIQDGGDGDQVALCGDSQMLTGAKCALHLVMLRTFVHCHILHPHLPR